MAIRAQIVERKALSVTTPEIFENEHDLSVVPRRHVEVVHSLIPDRKLGAWDVMASSPTVTLTLDNDLLLGATKIKSVQLFGRANTNFYGVTRMKK